jgi:ABC-2 type transport system ATP-binding protein
VNRTAVINISNLTKTYRNAGKPAVDELNLNIGRGEIFGLLGPNGAGKTTTISILCTHLQPTSGTVLINGKDIFKHRTEIRSEIGFVPQDIALYEQLTAKENLLFFGNMFGMKGKELKNKIDYWLDAFGLQEKAAKRIKTFSGGMKRRVNLIAALLHDPEILFLDEPTVGIDVQSKNVIIDYLKEINKNGTTIIYTSHHMDEAEHFCSRIAIIDYGKIIAKGKPDKLIEDCNGCEKLEDIFLKLTGRKLRD